MIELPTVDNPAVLVEGDALDVLASLPAGCVDAVITDPPYLLGSASTRRGERPQSPIADWTNASRWYRDWLAEAFRIAKPTAPVWVFGNWRTIPVIEIAVQSLARRITSTLVWDKAWIGVGSMNGLRCQYELAFLLGGPEFSIGDRTIGDIWTEKWSAARPHGHPQEKPTALVERMLGVSNVPEWGLVLDPFAGSGTVAEACLKQGRRSLSVELDPAYAAVARHRVAAYLSSGPLFAAAEQPSLFNEEES